MPDISVTPQHHSASQPKPIKHPGGLRYELPNKMEIAYQSRVELAHFYEDIFEKRVYLRHGITLNEGDCVFDVGANIGLFTLFVARNYPDVTIYAFEPAPPLFQILSANASSYAPTARLFNCGLSSETRDATFTFYPNSSGMSSFYGDEQEEKEVLYAIMRNELHKGVEGMEGVMKYADDILAERFKSQIFTCRLKTLSSIIREYQVERIDLLKVDVQKCEEEVILGIDEGDWKKIRQIVIEVHDFEGRLERMIALLKSHEYQVAVEQDQMYEGSLLYNLYAIRPDPSLRSGFEQLRNRALQQKAVLARQAKWWERERITMHTSEIDEALGSIAVIGMAGHFPGARNVAEFWQKLQNTRPGAETLDDVELFDPSFFDMSSREASLMDPQHRLLMMCAHEALEDAGYDPAIYAGVIGIYGGKGENHYLVRNVLPQEGDRARAEYRVLNDHDFLISFISSRLALRGPSINVQAADSTSLVAISMACQSLLNYQCDIALGGGVSISLPLRAGSGAGIVVLKRLAEAISDGDCIHAIIKGTAINHDRRVEVIGMAQAIAEVDPETVTHIETSGIAAPLRDAAAGVAGLIKTVLALNHKIIPNAQFSEWKSNGVPRRAGVSSFGAGGVNTHVVLEEAPERTSSSHSRPWQLFVLSARSEGALERATDNLVAYLKEHPEANEADLAYTLQTGRKSFAYRRVLVCKDHADGVTALETRNPRRVLTSVSAVDRKSVAFMFSGLGNHYVNMAHELYQTEPVFRNVVDQCSELLRPHLGLDLREVLYPNSKNGGAMSPQADSAPGGIDLRKMLRRGQVADEATDRLNQSLFSQPALFVLEYALARLWMSWGIYPDAMIGYSIGEYVAACLAEVFSLEDALLLVARRARLIQGLPGGAMLAVPLSEEEIQPLLSNGLSLSASNGPNISVVGGPTEAVTELQRQLTQEGLACQRLQVVHAFHSNMMSPILESLTETMRDLKLNPPKIPYLSNVTGDWITAEQAQDPKYWGEHLCQPVRFAEGVQRLWQQPGRLLVEIGPGQTLCAWAMQQPDIEGATERVALPSLRHSYEQQSDTAFILNALGRLWLAGVSIQWPAFYSHERRHRVSLPTYPFDLQRCWIEPETTLNPTVAATEIKPNGVEDSNAKELDQAESRRFLPTPYVAARNEIEEKLSQAWREVLNDHEVGVYDNFFALGGDSIRATQLVTRVSKTFETTLSLRDIFNSPTVADLAVLIVQRQAEQADAGALAQVLREIKQLP